jgi:hypothetical protein
VSKRLNQTSLYTFTDDPAGTLRYGPDATPTWDDAHIANHIEVNAPDGTRGRTGSGVAVETGAGSSTEDYGIIVKSIESQLESGGDRQALAEYHLFLYKQPLMRMPEVELLGQVNPASAWPAILDLEISDPITVERFAGLSSPMSLALTVEGFRMSGTGTTGMQVRIRTSPRDTRTLFQVAHATLGKVGTANGNRIPGTGQAA